MKSMIANSIPNQRWPKWLRWIFIAFGILFLLAVMTQLNFKGDINSADDQGLNPLVVLFCEFLAVMAMMQSILLTLRQGRDVPHILSAIFLALIGVFLIGVFSVLTGRIETLRQWSTLLAQTLERVAPLEYPPIIREPSAGRSDFLTYVTAITGLITAISGLLGQIISARKTKAELEIQRRQSEIKQPEAAPLQKKKRAGKRKLRK